MQSRNQLLQAETLKPYILSNSNGLEAHILPYGAIVQKLLIPDSKGALRDIVLGFDDLLPYQASAPGFSVFQPQHTVSQRSTGENPQLASHADSVVQDGISPYFGALVGRVANRIADATFELNGKTYHVTPNENRTSLHGGKFGFSRHVWEGKTFSDTMGHGVHLQYHSPAGDEVSTLRLLPCPQA